MVKRWVVHRAKSRRYSKRFWKQRHTLSWKEFVKLKFKKHKNFPKALKEAAKDWPKAKSMTPVEAKKNFGSYKKNQSPDDREIAEYFGQKYDNIKHMPRTRKLLRERYQQEN